MIHYDDLSKNQVYEMLKLRNEVFVVEQNCPYQDCDGKDLDAFHLLSYDQNDLVAYLRVLKPGVSYEEVSIGRVIVKESHRGLKLGRRIMTESIDFIQNALKFTTIRISAQAYLEKFYSDLGFVRVSENYLEDDIPHLEMLFEL